MTLAAALLGRDNGVASRVVQKAGADPAALAQRLQQAIERLPRVLRVDAATDTARMEAAA
jgi:hypothetical protein